MKDILTNWGISGEVIQIHDRIWDVSDQYIIKGYEHPEQLERNITLLNTLHNVGIPVAEIVPLTDGSDYVKTDGSYFVMCKKLKGSNLSDITRKPRETAYKMVVSPVILILISVRKIYVFLTLHIFCWVLCVKKRKRISARKSGMKLL